MNVAAAKGAAGGSAANQAADAAAKGAAGAAAANAAGGAVVNAAAGGGCGCKCTCCSDSRRVAVAAAALLWQRTHRASPATRSVRLHLSVAHRCRIGSRNTIMGKLTDCRDVAERRYNSKSIIAIVLVD